MLPSIAQVIIFLVLFFLAVLPVVLVLMSDRSSGKAKFGWFIATLLLSWLGYIVFRSATGKQLDRNNDV